MVQAQKTSAAFDEKVGFSNYKTFTFDEKGARNPYVNALIVEAVERKLTPRGLTKVNIDSDLKVVYLAATVANLQVQSVPFNKGVVKNFQKVSRQAQIIDDSTLVSRWAGKNEIVA